MPATLLDIVKLNGTDAEVGLIDETVKAHPELTAVSARTIKGINFRTKVRTALGNTAGSFRNANEGSSAPKHTYENRLVECFMMEPRFEVDAQAADDYEDGPEAYIALDTEGTMEGEMQALAKQFYYGRGTGGNAKGHPGLLDSLDTTNMVVDAGGTTDNVATSVWMVKFGPKAVQWVWGHGITLKLGPIRTESLIDSNDSTKKLDGYVQTGKARPGLQVVDRSAVLRIKKITADVGHTLNDSLINQGLLKFRAGIQPDAIFVTRRSLGQWQASRTATTTTGLPAPFPMEVMGLNRTVIPVYLTDSISETETLAL